VARKLIFWDWTGTLADESRLDKAVCLSMERAIAHKEGISLEEAEKKYLAHLKTLEKTWQWHDYLRHGETFGTDWKQAQVENINELEVMPGARDVLLAARSRRYINILATNAVQKVVELRLRYAGLESLFELVLGSDRAGALKAEGRHVSMGLAAFGGDPAFSFAVGDHPEQDVYPAARLGLKTIYCTLGAQRTHYHSRHLSTGEQPDDIRSDFRIESLPEILDII
jgi:FMN phosphatase YigB (HAD superfamily)